MTDDASDSHLPTPPPSEGNPLRGTVVAVSLMGIFFVLCWIGVFMLMLNRR